MCLVLELNEKSMERAATILKNGGVVVFPTETSYAMGAIVSSKKAVEKIKETKGRGKEKPLPIIVSGKEMAERYCELGKKAEKLVQEFMPGSLSLIVKKKPLLPDYVSRETVCFRISSSPAARALCEKTNSAIVSTSANLSGEKEIYSGKKAAESLGKKVQAVIDAGTLKPTPVSTIFEVKQGKILRQGPISEEKIRKALEEEK